MHHLGMRAEWSSQGPLKIAECDTTNHAAQNAAFKTREIFKRQTKRIGSRVHTSDQCLVLHNEIAKRKSDGGVRCSEHDHDSVTRQRSCARDECLRIACRLDHNICGPCTLCRRVWNARHLEQAHPRM